MHTKFQDILISGSWFINTFVTMGMFSKFAKVAHVHFSSWKQSIVGVSASWPHAIDTPTSHWHGVSSEECLGMASHSCWSRPRRAGSVAGGGWFSRTCLSRWSQKFSIGLRSRLQAGQSILTTPDPGIPPTIRHVSETSVCWLHGVRRQIHPLLTVFKNWNEHVWLLRISKTYPLSQKC